MKLSYAYLVVVAVGLLCVGCGSDAVTAGLNGSDDSGAAVKDQALTGTISGKPFTGKTAIGSDPASNKTMFIDIYDEDRTCETRGREPASGVKLLYTLDTPLAEKATQLSLANSLTFVVTEAGSTTPNNIIAFSGRVEIRKVPVVGTDGFLAIRAKSGAHQVEGTVKFIVCAN